MVSDNELMFKVQKGDIDKIGLLYERYNKILFGYFFKLTAKTEISEDLVNDTFFKIIENRTKFRGDGEFRIWMFRIARSVFADNYKKLKRLVFAEESAMPQQIPNNGGEWHEHNTQEENQKLLHHAMLKMKKKERELLVLSTFDGLKHKEIARIVNCSEGAVKVRVYRALKNLRDIYSKMQN